MEVKQCSICKEIKSINDFYKHADNKDKHQSWCKQCQSDKMHKWYINNYEHATIVWKKYKKNNPNYLKEYYIKNKVKLNLNSSEDYARKRDKYIKLAKLNYDNRDKEQYRYIKKIWEQNNKDKIKVYSARKRDKRRGIPKYSINDSIRSCIGKALKGGKSNLSWETLVGYTLEELMKHLEKQFQEGMNWDNYGRNGWVIDHIIPRSIWEFSSYTDREFKQCWCLANLQPLWAIDNLKKGNKT